MKEFQEKKREEAETGIKETEKNEIKENTEWHE